MSVIFEQPDVTPGISLGALHPCNPKEASSATAAALPSLSSSRRVNCGIGQLDAAPGPKGGRITTTNSILNVNEMRPRNRCPAVLICATRNLCFALMPLSDTLPTTCSYPNSLDRPFLLFCLHFS